MSSCCAPAKEAEEQPLLSSANLPRYSKQKVQDQVLKFDATQSDQDAADIVIAFGWDEEHDSPMMDSQSADMKQALRYDMLQRITRSGLPFTTMKSADKDQVFVLIGNVPEERLMEAAETMKLEVRLKKSWRVPYARFLMERKNDYVMDNVNEQRMFSSRDRQTLIMYILTEGDCETIDEMVVSTTLARTWLEKYGTIKYPTCGLNLDGYAWDGTIDGYFGMHSNIRRVELFSEWVYAPFRKQPLEKICEYLNSKTAIYFAFIGYYSSWLVISAIIGIVVTVYEYLSKHGNDSVCGAAFAVYMALWGTLFLEFWKRYNSELAYRWSTLNLNQEAHERAQFKRGCADVTEQGFYSASGVFVPYSEEALKPDKGLYGRLCSVEGAHWDFFDRINNSTEDIDASTTQELDQMAPSKVPVMDSSTQSNRICRNSGFALLAICILFVALVSFYIMRIILSKAIPSVGSLAGSFIQSGCIVLFNWIYCKIAVCMVDYENHRTDFEWEDALIQRVFVFQFINSYFALFYTAFFKGKTGFIHWLTGHPDHCLGKGGVEISCMDSLSHLLLSTLLIVQILSTLNEAALPWVLYKLQVWAEQAKWKRQGNLGELKLGEVDIQSKLTPNDPRDTFNDYNKMVLQFGYVTMFAAAFPCGALCALINNLIEMRTDAWKRLRAMQRPAPTARAENIGKWMDILQLMSIISIMSNIGVLCFTGEYFTKVQLQLTAEETVWLFIGIEHVVIVIKLIVMLAIPDVPVWVEKRAAHDAYMNFTRDDIIEKQRWERDLTAK